MSDSPHDDGFAWPQGAEPGAPVDGILGAFPTHGPLADFAVGAEILAQPRHDRAHRPWVLARGVRVVKAYQLLGLDEASRERIRAEADIALSLSEVPGVVQTLRAGEVDGWFVIEMARADAGLDVHLAAVRSGRAQSLTLAEYAEYFEGVAETLQRVHDRGVIHRDVKPANLLFSLDGRALLVADFSISGRRSRRARHDGPEGVAGTDRYIAPEQFDGRVSARSDQYSLGVTVLEAVRSVTGDDPVRAVLTRATDQRPEARFESIGAFGLALQSAVDGESRHRLASRMDRVSPAWRHSWASGLLAALLVYVGLLVLPLPDLTPARALIAPAAGLLTSVVVRILAMAHDGRSRPRLEMANQVWFAPLVVGGLYALGQSGGGIVDDSTLAAVLIFLLGYGFAAWLGSSPSDAGRWLIAPVRRWERRRRAGWSPARLWAVPVVGLVVVLAWLPVVLGERHAAAAAASDQRALEANASAAEKVRVIRGLRAAALTSTPGVGCLLIVEERRKGCDEWMAEAGKQLAADRARAGRRAFLGTGPVGAFRIVPIDRNSLRGYWIVPVVRGKDPAAPAAVGDVTITDRAAGIATIQIYPPDGNTQGRTWTYEVLSGRQRARISSVRTCLNTHCEELTQASATPSPASPPVDATTPAERHGS